MADVVDRMVQDESPAPGLVDDATAEAVRDIRAYVMSHPLDEGLRSRLAGRLRAEGAALQRGRRTTGRTELRRPQVQRSALAVATVAVAVLAIILALVRPGFLFGGGRLEAAEVLRRHEQATERGLQVQPGHVLHTVIRLGPPERADTEESWQLVGPDGLVARSYDRVALAQGTIERWFDGRFRIIRQQGRDVTAAPMAPFRPTGGLGSFDEVRRQLGLGMPPGGPPAGAPPTGGNENPTGPYRVTGRGRVAGRETIVVESRLERLEFDANTYQLLAIVYYRVNEHGQHVIFLDRVVVNQEVLDATSSGLPPALYTPPAINVAAAAAQPPAIPPDAPALPGLPAYVPPGLSLHSTSVRSPGQGPMANALSAVYQGQLGRVTIQRAPTSSGCQDAGRTCQTADVNGRAATIRTSQQGGEVWHWLQWDDEQGSILMHGTVPPDQMLKMARSMPLRPGGSAPQPPLPQGTALPAPAVAPSPGASAAGDPTVATDLVDFLGRFMEARRGRREPWVRASLTDPLASAMNTTPMAAAEIQLLPAGNPCWNAWEIVRFEQRTPTTATARARVFEYIWSDGNGDGLVRSWDQELALRRVAGAVDGPWRVAQLSRPENVREYPNAPHGPTTSACRGAAQQQADDARAVALTAHLDGTLSPADRALLGEVRVVGETATVKTNFPGGGNGLAPNKAALAAVCDVFRDGVVARANGITTIRVDSSDGQLLTGCDLAR